MAAKRKTQAQIKKEARFAWKVLWAILALTLVLEFFMEPHPHFEVDGWPAFHAWYGFAACIGIILVAKALAFLKRGEDYYGGDE
jgi:hypothetical protein